MKELPTLSIYDIACKSMNLGVTNVNHLCIGAVYYISYKDDDSDGYFCQVITNTQYISLNYNAQKSKLVADTATQFYLRTAWFQVSNVDYERWILYANSLEEASERLKADSGKVELPLWKQNLG